MSQEPVNKRVKYLIDDYEKRSQKYFAEKIGISASAVSSLFSKRGNKPGLDMLQKIAIAYPEISLDWLLVGRGSMLKHDYEELVKAPSGTAQSTEVLEGLMEKILASQANRRRIDGQTSSAMAERHGAITAELRQLSVLIAELGLKMHNMTVGNEKLSEVDEAFSTANDEYLSLLELQRLKHSELMTLRQMEISAIQEAKNTVYRIHGEPDISKPFGGLLPYRLGVPETIALQLVSTGLIRGKLIDGAGYRVTEQAVCDYLGESNT